MIRGRSFVTFTIDAPSSAGHRGWERAAVKPDSTPLQAGRAHRSSPKLRIAGPNTAGKRQWRRPCEASPENRGTKRRLRPCRNVQFVHRYGIPNNMLCTNCHGVPHCSPQRTAAALQDARANTHGHMTQRQTPGNKYNAASWPPHRPHTPRARGSVRRCSRPCACAQCHSPTPPMTC